MSSTAYAQTPTNYIRSALENPRGIAAHQYKEQLKALLKDPYDDARDVFLQFRNAARLNASLSSTFYSAVCDVFKKLNESLTQPQRWNGKMAALVEASRDDPTLLKYLRETLMSRALPDLIASHPTDTNLHVASDIIAVASTAPDLADTIKPEYARPIVMMHFKNAGCHFEIAAPHFTRLRAMPSFLSAIEHLENKHGIHVDSLPLPHDPNKNLVLKFCQVHENIETYVVDLSKPSRAMHPHGITLDDATSKYKKSVVDILERAADLDDPSWVAPIATEAYCRLG